MKNSKCENTNKRGVAKNSKAAHPEPGFTSVLANYHHL